MDYIMVSVSSVKLMFFGESHHDVTSSLVNKCVLSSAYRVKLVSVSQSHYDQYEMEIVQVIKEGTSARV